MSEKKYGTTTRVRVIVELYTGTYGPEWKIDDIRKQAHREGIEGVRAALMRDPMKNGQHMKVGETAVVLTIIEEEKP